MTVGGYAGSILYVNLTTGKVRKEPLDMEVARSFIGGFGINAKLGYDLIVPGIDPLSTDNKIIIGAGPFVGTNIPGSARVSSVTKLPVNGAVGWSGGGAMSFGVMLKNSGYDHVVIEGRANSPVYLKILDDEVEMCDATAIWGKGSQETVDTLYALHGRPLGVLSIGQAGENLVRISMAFVEKCGTLGRGGLGAVFGAKNLKAIVVRGTKGIRVSDRKRYMQLVEGLYERMRKYEGLKGAQIYGFLNFMPVMPREDYLRLKKARLACVSCPIGDKDLLEIRDGRFKGRSVYCSAAVNTLMPIMYGFTRDYGESIKLFEDLDSYGLDQMEALEILKFANQLYEHGIVTENDLGAPGIRFDPESVAEWLRKISFREGFGNVLADGFGELLKRYGNAARSLLPVVVKGMVAYQGITSPIKTDLFTTFEFGMAVHPKGPCAAPGGSSPLYFTRGRPLEWVAGHLDRMGVPKDAQERILTPKEGMALNVGRMTKYSQLSLFVVDMLGTCGRGQINRFYSNKLQAELYSAVTGLEMSGQELLKAAERALNLIKAANVREGFDRKEDCFPESWFGTEKHKDYYEKVEITKEKAYGMLDDYYDEMGWDVKTGIPTLAKLKELGLEYVAEDGKRLGIVYP